ncbi:hypothetical protein Y032_0023g847 [Ancylostoma ceylanicum]|uniref:Uncharacterized protein n=1 Tax=Ancylostoma ceylanicum TaxID=53326 RepID=A0A016UZ80_9BILA|nr:hypothetical protein Y032_0023g847 [Ancylostoma ceylanicum]
MSDDHLRKCVIDELRKAQGEPLSAEELFERCGGAKATNLNVDRFRNFIGQHCSRAVKAVHDMGDENSLPRYALHVDHARKTGTLKRRTARSKSQSSSRGGTPEANNTRFNPRAEGFSIFCQIVRKLSAASQDGTINWNAIRNQYRKETGRHLLTEELNGMCGTVNMTKHDLLTTYLSTVVEILDSRGQIVRPASPFSPKTPSPIASHSPPKDQELSPMASAVADEIRGEVLQDDVRRQHIVEQLKKNGVFVDGTDKVAPEKRTPLPSQSSEFAEEEEVVKTSSREVLQTPESDHASFMSVNQTLETSGEVGYTTGDDATPESDISLDFTADNSALGSTPCRTHEITLCTVDDSVIHHEVDENVNKHVVERDVIAEADHSEDDRDVEHMESRHQFEEEKLRSDLPVEQVQRESTIVIEEAELDEPEEVFEKKSARDVVEAKESVAEDKHRDIPVILITEPCEESVTKEECQQSIDEENVEENNEHEESKEVISMLDSDVGEEYLLEPHMTNKIVFSSVSDADFEEPAKQDEGQMYIGEVTPVTPIKERMMVFERKEEEEVEVPPAEVVMNVEVPVREKVEKFEHLQEENLDESRVSYISEGDMDNLEKVDVMERVHELEQSVVEEEEPVVEHEEQAVPPATHVLETVHKLEHEFNKSLPVCEEYVHITEHEKEELKSAGDGPSSESVSGEGMHIGPVGDVAVSHEVEITRREGLAAKAVTVTVEEVTIDPSGFSAETEARITDSTNAAVTHRVVVDVIPRTARKPRLSNSDSWEKAFVVASGSASAELSGTQIATSVERDVTAARDFLREVDKLETESKVSRTVGFVTIHHRLSLRSDEGIICRKLIGIKERDKSRAFT